MKKYLYISALFLFSISGAMAQSGIDDVLQSIATNNKNLQAGARLNEAQKLEARTGNYLSNPTIEFNQLWGDKATGGNLNEMTVVQSFDFPTVYSNKRKLTGIKSATYDHQYAASRQEILLAAKQTCIEIIYLRKQKKLLDERLSNAERLMELYNRRLEKGDANQLEINKIQLERLNAQNAARLNQATLKARLEQLQNQNGGVSIEFKDEDYSGINVLPAFEQLQNDYLATDPNLKNLAGQAEMAGREIRLNRAQSLPKIDLGYRRNGGSEETMNGFVVGLSIPLFENKNTVKKAKAQFEYSNVIMESNTLTLKSNLRQQYDQANALLESRNEYASILSAQHSVELLNKALQAGQISMIDYFIEVTTLYDSKQNYLNVEKDYFSTVAQLLQYQL